MFSFSSLLRNDLTICLNGRREREVSGMKANTPQFPCLKILKMVGEFIGPEPIWTAD